MVGRSLLDAPVRERARRRRHRRCRCATFRCRSRSGTAGGRCSTASASICMPAKSWALAGLLGAGRTEILETIFGSTDGRSRRRDQHRRRDRRHPLAARRKAARHRAGDRGPQDARPASAGVDHRQCRAAAGRIVWRASASAPSPAKPGSPATRSRRSASAAKASTRRPARCPAAISRRS